MNQLPRWKMWHSTQNTFKHVVTNTRKTCQQIVIINECHLKRILLQCYINEHANELLE